jgi:hypothetical protein
MSEAYIERGIELNEMTLRAVEAQQEEWERGLLNIHQLHVPGSLDRSHSSLRKLLVLITHIFHSFSRFLQIQRFFQQLPFLRLACGFPQTKCLESLPPKLFVTSQTIVNWDPQIIRTWPHLPGMSHKIPSLCPKAFRSSSAGSLRLQLSSLSSNVTLRRCMSRCRVGRWHKSHCTCKTAKVAHQHSQMNTS